jgi:hypothetical protein
MLIGLNRLKKIIDQTIEGETGIIHNKCIDCGFPVEVEVHKTVDGYGLLGGVLYEVGDCLYAKCADCYESDPDLNSNLKSLQNVHL